MYWLLVLLVGTVVAQEHERCCHPNQYEGFINFAVASAEGPDKPLVRSLGEATVHYDFLGKQFATTRFVQQGEEEYHYKVVDKFHLGERYVVVGEDCTMSPLHEEMAPPCIRPELEFLGESVIGAEPAQHLWTETWHESGEHFYERDTIIRDGCIPYAYRQTVRHSERPEVPEYVIHVGTYNRVEEGIRDQSVFDIPEQCKAMRTMVKTPPELSFIEDLFLKR